MERNGCDNKEGPACLPLSPSPWGGSICQAAEIVLAHFPIQSWILQAGPPDWSYEYLQCRLRIFTACPPQYTHTPTLLHSLLVLERREEGAGRGGGGGERGRGGGMREEGEKEEEEEA